jgi:GNAT superfamily N-acetyltransferase
MVLVRETVADDWQALRDIRLEALRDAPTAFGSTYEQETERGEAHWRDRIARGGTFLAFVPEVSATEPSGLIGGYQEDPVTVELVSMYVRPRARGRGVGEALVAAVIDWAGQRNAAAVRLWVTETNTPALALYERCGFALTGERQPVPFHPSIDEVAMIRRL